jgi:hypothetical protein
VCVLTVPHVPTLPSRGLTKPYENMGLEIMTSYWPRDITAEIVA